MARRFLAALALAHSATALLEGFVDVLVQVDEVRVPADLVADVLQAAGSDGYEACETADAAISYCYNAGYLDPTAPAVLGNFCLCCDGRTPLSTAYSSCASYALNDVPDATSAYQAASLIYSICSNSIVCGATATSRVAPTRTASNGNPIITPPVCSSMLNIYASCSDKLGRTALPEEAASCFCPEVSGTVNTAFQDYASSCAPWAESTYPRDYSIVSRLATYCDEYLSPTTEAPFFTTAGTRTGAEFVRPSTTSAAGDADNNGNNGDNGTTQGAETTSTSTGLAAQGLAVPGGLAWFANLVTVFLSFFFMI